MKEQSFEVLVADEPLLVVSADGIDEVKRRASASGRRRARICAHASSDEPLHEMLIVLDRETYIRPHRHHAKAESFLVLEGEADIVFFDAEGGISRVVRVGAYGSGHAFYYRVSDARYHTVVVRTPIVAFHEATTGPFLPAQTEHAPWAPPEGETAAIATWRGQLDRRLAERADP